MWINTRNLSLAWWWTALVLLAIAVAGCQPSVTPVANITPTLLAVQVTPALLRHRPAFNACASSANLGLVIDDLPAQALDPGGVDLTLRWGGPGTHQGPAYQIAREPLVVIVHPSNRQDWTHPAIVQQIYTGEVNAWSSPGDQPVTTPTAKDSIHPWAYPAGDDAQQAFETTLLAGNPPSSQAVALAPGPDAMLEAVAGDPAAIGFIPAGWLNDSVKAVEVIEVESGLLDLPVLALSEEEPTGLTLDWLLCVQAAIEKEAYDN